MADILNILLDDDVLNIHIAEHVINELGEPLADDYNLVPDQRNIIVRNENYYEYTIPHYELQQFRDHFRMSRGTFNELLNTIINNRNIHNDIIPLEKKLMFTIWVLSKPETFIAAGDRFGLSKSTGHKIFKEMVENLQGLIPLYIRWPNRGNCNATANIFEARSQGFPGVIGAVDGCHIPCKQPPGNPIDYYNRKGFHSIILQGICNENAVFIDIFIGMPGRMHDARVFRNSQIGQQLLGDNMFLPNNYHIIGDSAYPLHRRLMTPFRDNGHLTPAQIRYNTKLSMIRSIIERAFGLLKIKFRRLKYLDISDFQLGNSIIAAACVVHNFILLQGNPQDDYNLEDGNVEIEVYDVDENDQFELNIVGEDKRNDIVQLYN